MGEGGFWCIKGCFCVYCCGLLSVFFRELGSSQFYGLVGHIREERWWVLETRKNRSRRKSARLGSHFVVQGELGQPGSRRRG